MPSKARINLEQTRTEIRDFYAVHQLVKGIPGVRKKLDVLNKGTIVLLSAIWEGFCEDITSEALALIIEEAPTATVLPVPLQRAIALELKDSRHELAIWQLADNGWRDVLRARLKGMQEKRNRRLNSPQSANIDELFRQALGIDGLSSNWATAGTSAEENAAKLDQFVELRNSIAHRGLGNTAVNKVTVRKFVNQVHLLAIPTESTVEVSVAQAIGRWPWNDTQH